MQTKERVTPTLGRLVVMEDAEDVRQAMVNTLEHGPYPFEVIPVESKEDVLRCVEQEQVDGVILDIHMGTDRPTEGIEVLRILKYRVPDIWVGVYSGQEHQKLRMAEKAKADYTLAKRNSITNDMQVLALEWMRYQTETLKRVQETLNRVKEESQPNNDILEDELDVNRETFELDMLDDEWLREHQGHHVAYVGGKMVGEDEDFSTLLERVRRDYPDQHRFYGSVMYEEEEVDLPGIFFVEDD